MHNTILIVALAIMILAVFIAGIRFVKKSSHVLNKVIAFDVMTVSSIAIIGVIAALSDRIIYMDIAMVYGLLSFLAVIIIAKYLEKSL